MEVEGASPRGRPRKTWLEVVRNDLKELSLASMDALDRHAWKKKIVGDTCWSRFAWSSLGILPRTSRPLNGACVTLEFYFPGARSARPSRAYAPGSGQDIVSSVRVARRRRPRELQTESRLCRQLVQHVPRAWSAGQHRLVTNPPGNPRRKE